MSDLDCWTEGHLSSYDPFIKSKAQELDECLEITREIYQRIRSTSLESLTTLTTQEKMAVRQCLVQGLSIIMDDDLHKKIEECLKLLRRE